jgi:BCD family chlorophyll transporter-like MFS transporter
LQFGGLAIVPFCLLVLTGDGHGPAWTGQVGAALAFLLIGAGMHTTQTAGLALATEIAPAHSRPRVVALLYVMLLIGMASTAWIFGYLLTEFTPTRLVQVVQSAAVVTLVLNTVALWKQEARNPDLTKAVRTVPPFRKVWKEFLRQKDASRLLITVGLGSAAFSMQDILLEPYGGQVLGMTVSQTTALTGLLSMGTLIALGVAAHVLDKRLLPARLAVIGALVGIVGFTLIVFGGSLVWIWLFQLGTFLIGVAVGLFSVGMLIEAMRLADASGSGIALGAWGAVHASAAGLAIACGGFLRDLVTSLLNSGRLGTGLNGDQIGYAFVYHLEIALLFACLIAMGPLVRYSRERPQPQSNGLVMAEFPN